MDKKRSPTLQKENRMNTPPYLNKDNPKLPNQNVKTEQHEIKISKSIMSPSKIKTPDRSRQNVVVKPTLQKEYSQNYPKHKHRYKVTK